VGLALEKPARRDNSQNSFIIWGFLIQVSLTV